MKMIASLVFVFALLLVGMCQAETITTYWPNGQKKCETNYKDGKWHGLATTWGEDGRKWEANYKDGKYHGLMTWWDKEGNVTNQVKYVNGKRIK